VEFFPRNSTTRMIFPTQNLDDWGIPTGNPTAGLLDMNCTLLNENWHLQYQLLVDSGVYPIFWFANKPPKVRVTKKHIFSFVFPTSPGWMGTRFRYRVQQRSAFTQYSGEGTGSSLHCILHLSLILTLNSLFFVRVGNCGIQKCQGRIELYHLFL
jgi:hypothetical protein